MTEQKAQSNQDPKAQNKGRKVRPEAKVRGKRSFDASELTQFLDTLNVGVTPVIHVNGTTNPTAVLTIDFGAPLNPVRLTQDQVQDLMGRMRKATRELYSNDVNVRVSMDHQNGIYWASVA